MKFLRLESFMLRISLYFFLEKLLFFFFLKCELQTKFDLSSAIFLHFPRKLPKKSLSSCSIAIDKRHWASRKWVEDKKKRKIENAVREWQRRISKEAKCRNVNSQHVANRRFMMSISPFVLNLLCTKAFSMKYCISTIEKCIKQCSIDATIKMQSDSIPNTLWVRVKKGWEMIKINWKTNTSAAWINFTFLLSFPKTEISSRHI